MKGLALAACLLVVAFAHPAFGGDDAREAAAAKFKEAEAAFARRAYRESAEAFEAAAGLAPHPSVWLNASEAWEAAAEPLRAALDCERALAMSDISPPAKDEATRRVARLAARLGRLEIVGPPSIRVGIDGAPPEALPLRRWAMPGTHALHVIEGLTARDTQVELAAGERRTIELANAAAPPPTSPSHRSADVTTADPAEPSLAPPAATWVCFGIAGAGAIVTGVFGGLTVAAQSDFDTEPTRDHADAFDRDKLVTNIALGTTLAAAAAGTIIWIIDATTRSPSVSLRATTRAAELTLRAPF